VNSHLKTIAIWLVVFAAVVIAYQIFTTASNQEIELNQTEFYGFVSNNEVLEITMSGDGAGYEIRGSFATPQNSGRGGPQVTTFRSYITDSDDIHQLLREHQVKVTVEPPQDASFFSMLLMWSPMLLFLGVWIFFMRQMQSGGNRALSFGKSKAKLTTSHGKKVTFNDVAGVEEAKAELHEIIEFLKEPQKFQKLGGKIPKGVLLMGPPGTGKTLLARAIAGEANVPFFSISGSDFVEMFVGVGASRVRDLFEQGKKNAPCIIFIDEIDAVGRHRGAGLGGGHDEREQTLNQLLVEMDGFETNEGVILIAATNRPDVLDPALLRPGRFDRQVVVGLPDVRGREMILIVHARKIKTTKAIDLSLIARSTPGFSGADLANLVNEAALHAARRNREAVAQEDFEIAKDKVMMGTERKSLVISDDEKRSTAFHEAGHALIAMVLDDADPLHKVTIIPRGHALGLTMQLPIDDRHTYSKKFLTATITVMMGGRVAEELKLDLVTTGAKNDFERASEMARKMVTEWGMSTEIGPMCYGKQEEQIFLGREISQHRDYSEQTAQAIDKEVRQIILTCYQHAEQILTENDVALAAIAENLLIHEVLDVSQVETLIKGGTLPEIVPPTVDDAEKTVKATGSDTDSEPTDDTGKGSGVLPEPGNQPA
jgi:cell division protease FtsH